VGTGDIVCREGLLVGPLRQLPSYARNVARRNGGGGVSPTVPDVGDHRRDLGVRQFPAESGHCRAGRGGIGRDAPRSPQDGFLKAFGFTPEVFSSAEEFLQSDRLDEASCLITDVHLRGMSGLRLQSRLAASGSRIPVIVITAFPDDGVCERALSAGAVDFLNKPFNTGDLLTWIRSALNRPRGDGTHR